MFVILLLFLLSMSAKNISHSNSTDKLVSIGRLNKYLQTRWNSPFKKQPGVNCQIYTRVSQLRDKLNSSSYHPAAFLDKSIPLDIEKRKKNLIKENNNIDVDLRGAHIKRNFNLWYRASKMSNPRLSIRLKDTCVEKWEISIDSAALHLCVCWITENSTGWN